MENDKWSQWGGWSHGYIPLVEVIDEIKKGPIHKSQNTCERVEITIIRNPGYDKLYKGLSPEDQEAKPFTSWKVKFYD